MKSPQLNEIINLNMKSVTVKKRTGKIRPSKPAKRRKKMTGLNKIKKARAVLPRSAVVEDIKSSPVPEVRVPARPAPRALVLKVIPVNVQAHQLSPHILGLAAAESQREALVPTYDILARRHRNFYWFDELSILSVGGLLAAILLAVVKHVFRIPVSEIKRLTVRRSRPAVASKKPSENLAPVTPILIEDKDSNPKPITATGFKLQSFTVPRAVVGGGLWSGAAIAALAGLIILAPLKLAAEVIQLRSQREQIVSEAAIGLSSLVAGGQAAISYDFFKAAGAFEDAANHFYGANEAIEGIPPVLKFLAGVLPEGKKLASGEALLRAGAALSRVGEKVSAGFVFLDHQTSAKESLDAAELLRQLASVSGGINPDLDEAIAALAAVNKEDIPIDYQPAFEQVRLLLPVIKTGLNELMAINEVAPELLGINGPKRYLIMFQNNHELRASGGFLGSFAIIDVKDGKVERLNVPGGGTYDLQGGLIPRLLAPEPLRLINPRWELQDANWWPDWPTSAQKISWFYRQSGGESVDGIMAIDIDVIESLLEITGPISMPAYDLTVTADNFANEAQAEVEIRYDRLANRPKQFIADLAPLLIGRLETVLGQDAFRLAQTLTRVLSEKHFLIYSEQEAVQTRLRELKWAGAMDIRPPFTDTIGIVHTNIAGGKTDGVISDSVEHNIVRQSDGSLTATLILTRAHHGQKGELFTGVRNVDYLRFYLPLGSRLIDADGFTYPDQALFQVPDSDLVIDDDLRDSIINSRRDPTSGMTVYEELGRTVFAHWLMVDPGESATVKIVYELPWRLSNQPSVVWQPWSSYFGWSDNLHSYRLIWEKQSGTGATKLKHTFRDQNPIAMRSSSGNITVANNGWTWETILKGDASLAVTYADSPKF